MFDDMDIKKKVIDMAVEDPAFSTVYDEGWAAYTNGLSYADNPYMYNTVLAARTGTEFAQRAWDAGWIDAMDSETNGAPE